MTATERRLKRGLPDRRAMGRCPHRDRCAMGRMPLPDPPGHAFRERSPFWGPRRIPEREELRAAPSRSIKKGGISPFFRLGFQLPMLC
jgi:hypothetical protein